MIDLVYIVGPLSPYNDLELRYSLRSVERYMGGLKYNGRVKSVFIVGHKPDFIQNVIHIPCEDPYGYPAHKEQNILFKVVKACNDPRLSEDIILMDDDVFLNALSWAPTLPYYYDGSLQEYQARIPAVNMYHGTLANTIATLEAHGSPTRNFNVHSPWRINKLTFPSVMAGFNFAQHNGLAIQSLYYNTVSGIIGTKTDDLKFNEPMSISEIKDKIAGKRFFSCGDKGFESLLPVLEEMFPTPSKYETT